MLLALFLDPTSIPATHPLGEPHEVGVGNVPLYSRQHPTCAGDGASLPGQATSTVDLAAHWTPKSTAATEFAPRPLGTTTPPDLPVAKSVEELLYIESEYQILTVLPVAHANPCCASPSESGSIATRQVEKTDG